MTGPHGPRFARRDLVFAGIVTAIVPMAAAFTTYWLAPWSCDASAWLCLLQLSLIGVGPVAALCLPLALTLNRRRRAPFPDGLLPVMAVTGVVAQALVSACSLWLASPVLRRVFLFDVLILPQGLVAGVLVGAVFRLALTGLAGRRRPG